jgi:hypothetical protein
LTGHTPIDALKRATELLHDDADPLRPVHELNPDVPVAVSNVLMRALALRPTLRPASAADLRAALTQARLGVPAPTTQADDETARISLPTTIAYAETIQASERDTVLLPSRAKTTSAQEATPNTGETKPHAPETLTVVAPRTQTRRRLPIYALAGLLCALLLACGLYAYQVHRNATQAQSAAAPQSTAQTEPLPVASLQPTSQGTTQPVHPTPTVPAPTPSATHTPMQDSGAKERARQEQEQRAEQQRTEEERRAAEDEQRAAEEEAAREREREGGRANANPIPPDPGAVLALQNAATRLRIQLQSAESEYRQARLTLTNAQRELKLAQNLYREGRGSQAAVAAATARVSAAADALEPAMTKYQTQRAALREVERQLGHMNGPQQFRPRRMNGTPPTPPRTP